MGRQTVLAVARGVQESHRRLAASAELPDAARDLVDEISARLVTLTAELQDREQRIEALHEIIGDRMNNLLMAIQTARDLLRTSEGSANDAIRERLESTVSNGRECVKRFRENLVNLR